MTYEVANFLSWQEKNSKADQPASTQSLKTRDGEKSPVMETPPTLQKKHSGNSIALFQPSSPKKTDAIIGPGSSILRRRRSSESLPDDSFTGTRVITFSSKGEQVVHCGKCLGTFLLPISYFYISVMPWLLAQISSSNSENKLLWWHVVIHRSRFLRITSIQCHECDTWWT